RSAAAVPPSRARRPAPSTAAHRAGRAAGTDWAGCSAPAAPAAHRSTPHPGARSDPAGPRARVPDAWSRSCVGLPHLRACTAERAMAVHGRGGRTVRTTDQLLRDREVALRTDGLDVVQEDRRPVARRLGKAHVTGADGREHPGAEVFLGVSG